MTSGRLHRLAGRRSRATTVMTATSDARPALAVVGERDARAARVLERIVASPSGAPVSSWRVDTKYYVADVSCAVCVLPPGAARDAAPSPPLPASAEALVLCFDPTADGAFERATAWAESRFPRDAPAGPEIRLLACVYPTAADADARDMRETRDADAWAVDNAFEAVAIIAAPEDAARDDALRVDGDPHGATRLRAALEAHVWPGLDLKAPRGAEPVAEQCAEPVAEPGAEPGAEPDVSPSIPPGASDDVLAALEAEALAEDDDDDDADVLTSLAAEMARVRAEGAGASDETRRRLAAEAATRMMRMFLGDDEDDEESADDEDEEASGDRRRTSAAAREE